MKKLFTILTFSVGMAVALPSLANNTAATTAAVGSHVQTVRELCKARGTMAAQMLMATHVGYTLPQARDMYMDIVAKDKEAHLVIREAMANQVREAYNALNRNFEVYRQEDVTTRVGDSIEQRCLYQNGIK